jgi:cell division protease FtsH
MNKVEFYDFLKKFSDIHSLIKFLQIIKDSKPKLETRNYQKSLIFVLGNLDECFTMSSDLNSDLDADYFYEKTKNTSIIDIRKALLKRFRAEQIARLGSTHIIYPSLNKKAFKSIISKELLTFEKMVKEKFSNEESTIVNSVSFSENINDLIYKEGVFPVVGARSVFSIVNEIISDKFPFIIKNLLSFDVTSNKSVDVKFEYFKRTTTIEISFYNSESKALITKENFKYNVKIDKLRIEKDKGKQIHRAVHEAGHAVCSIILENSFPEVVYSVVLNNRDSGFNLLNSDDFYYHRKNTYMNRIGTILGGYAAETIIFGDENVSNGSSSDIENATSLLNTLMKDTGFMTNMIGKYVSKSFVSTMMENANYSLIDENDVINNRIQKMLTDGLEMSMKTLTQQKVLFLKVSEYLSKNPKMTNKKLKELTKKYILNINYEDLLKDKQSFYVDMLNEELNKLKY